MCIEHARQFSSQVDKLVDVLVNLKTLTITFNADARYMKPTQLSISQALQWDFYSFLASDLAYPQDALVTPSNAYLAASLLAAKTVNLDLKYDAPENGRVDVATHQVCVLSACILLSVCGSHLLGQRDFDPSNVLTTLQRIKNVGVVKDAHGQQLLEVAIQQAKDGFKSDVDDAWNILFPP